MARPAQTGVLVGQPDDVHLRGQGHCLGRLQRAGSRPVACVRSSCERGSVSRACRAGCRDSHHCRHGRWQVVGGQVGSSESAGQTDSRAPERHDVPPATPQAPASTGRCGRQRCVRLVTAKGGRASSTSGIVVATCRREAPALQAVSQRDHQDVQFVGINARTMKRTPGLSSRSSST